MLRGEKSVYDDAFFVSQKNVKSLGDYRPLGQFYYLNEFVKRSKYMKKGGFVPDIKVIQSPIYKSR